MDRFLRFFGLIFFSQHEKEVVALLSQLDAEVSSKSLIYNQFTYLSQEHANLWRRYDALQEIVFKNYGIIHDEEKVHHNDRDIKPIEMRKPSGRQILFDMEKADRASELRKQEEHWKKNYEVTEIPPQEKTDA